LDSAAFFIIQSNPALKAGTWQGEVHLWANGLLHLLAALASAWLLRRRGLIFVLSAAFLMLGIACLLLLHPSRVLFASIFYPIGVSLYSVALVAYPSLLSPASSAGQRGRQAGWIYATAGWGGSAMGIGMGQNLGHVPPAFVIAAGAVVLIPGLFTALRWRARELALTALVALASFCLYRLVPSANTSAQQSQLERGRQVYISEGCIQTPPMSSCGDQPRQSRTFACRSRRSSVIAARVPIFLKSGRAVHRSGSKHTSLTLPKSVVLRLCPLSISSFAMAVETILLPISQACMEPAR
jgi:MFS family permease